VKSPNLLLYPATHSMRRGHLASNPSHRRRNNSLSCRRERRPQRGHGRHSTTYGNQSRAKQARAIAAENLNLHLTSYVDTRVAAVAPCPLTIERCSPLFVRRGRRKLITASHSGVILFSIRQRRRRMCFGYLRTLGMITAFSHYLTTSASYGICLPLLSTR
jgi:hypothetical protein